MAEGLTGDLLLAALTVGLLGFWISSRDLPLPAALVVTFIKAAIPTAYFAYFFDDTWTIRDDLTYLLNGTNMLQSGLTPLTALTTAGGRSELLLGGEKDSSHYLYDWWNLLGVYLYGEHYYAAVFLNVLLTFVAGYFLFRLARMSGFGRGYARGLLVFFLLHWELLVWSSLINMKDVFVMTLTVISFYFVLKLFERVSIGSLVALAALIPIFAAIRFYIPAAIVAAVAAWGLLYLSGRSRLLLLFGTAVGALGVLGVLGPDRILDNLGRLDFASIVPGTINMVLTPQPWSISPSYSFLLLPSAMHWLLFLPALFGGYLLWRRSREAALLLIYLALMLLFYGAFPEEQGPRFRVQLIFIVAWAQFHFLWVVVREAARAPAPAPRPAKQTVAAERVP